MCDGVEGSINYYLLGRKGALFSGSSGGLEGSINYIFIYNRMRALLFGICDRVKGSINY